MYYVRAPTHMPMLIYGAPYINIGTRVGARIIYARGAAGYGRQWSRDELIHMYMGKHNIVAGATYATTCKSGR